MSRLSAPTNSTAGFYGVARPNSYGCCPSSRRRGWPASAARWPCLNVSPAPTPPPARSMASRRSFSAFCWPPSRGFQVHSGARFRVRQQWFGVYWVAELRFQFDGWLQISVSTDAVCFHVGKHWRTCTTAGIGWANVIGQQHSAYMCIYYILFLHMYYMYSASRC